MSKLPINVWLLTLILSLAMSAGAMMVIVGGVLGAQLAPSPQFSTLPIALMILGTACGVVPITRLMGNVGRKPVFIGVALLSTSSALLAAYSAYITNFYVFLVGSFMLGVAVSGFQQIRFAAMESVSVDLMPKAASTVLLGGLGAAVIGPELVTLGKDWFEQDFVGTFVLMSILGIFCALLFSQFTETHVPVFEKIKTKVPVSDVLVKPLFIIAVSVSVVGYALMSFIMTATPVHMHIAEHHSLEHTKWVIQSHVIAMYLPSLISGWLIARLGVNKVIVLGLCCYLVMIVAALAGSSFLNYWVALVMLGIGWNFLFLGGTVLLPKTYAEPQKFKVQGINEFSVFTAQAMAALGAGAMLYALGWRGLMYTSLSIIGVQFLLLIWQAYRIKQSSLSVSKG